MQTFRNATRKHIVTIWEKKGTAERSFSLMSSCPEHFEWITDPKGTDPRKLQGPEIYITNGFLDLMATINSTTLQSLATKSGVGPMSLRMRALFMEELEKIITYKTWLEEHQGLNNWQLVNKVFNWNPKRNQWEVRKDAPNPLLAFEYYKLYQEFKEIEESPNRKTFV